MLLRSTLSVCLSAVLALSAAGQEPTPQPNSSLDGTNGSCDTPSTPSPDRATAPCHCLQQMVMNLPGPNDLYYALSYNSEVCDDLTAAEDYWYGVPTFPLVQDCDESTCEPHVRFSTFRSTPTARGGTADFGHHGMRLVQTSAAGEDTIQADTFVLALMRSSNAIGPDVRPEYFVFRAREVNVNRDVPVIAIPVVISDPKSPIHGKTRYFCFELERNQSSGLAKKVTVRSSRDGQVTVDFLRPGDPDTDPTLRGLIWLKYPRD